MRVPPLGALAATLGLATAGLRAPSPDPRFAQSPAARADTAADSARGPGAPAPGSLRRALGRVVHASAAALTPLAGERVTLHRVGSDTAGPLDSTRTGPDGRYRFTYRTSGAPDAVYFVSATYDGIAYLSQPLTQAVVRGDEAEITVYDTTSRPIPLRVRGQHLVVSAPAATGLRSVVEVFELSNDTTVTLVSPGGGTDRPTWSVQLPPGAQGFQVGQGDISADAVTVTGSRVAAFAPFAPGLKQVSFSYALPPSAFPLVRPLPTAAIVLEVLLEETGARVSGAKFRTEAPVAVEGRVFRRFLAQDVPAGAVVRVSVPVVFASHRQMYIAVVVVVLGATMLGALAVAFRRGGAR